MTSTEIVALCYAATAIGHLGIASFILAVNDAPFERALKWFVASAFFPVFWLSVVYFQVYTMLASFFRGRRVSSLQVRR